MRSLSSILSTSLLSRWASYAESPITNIPKSSIPISIQSSCLQQLLLFLYAKAEKIKNRTERMMKKYGKEKSNKNGFSNSITDGSAKSTYRIVTMKKTREMKKNAPETNNQNHEAATKKQLGLIWTFSSLIFFRTFELIGSPVFSDSVIFLVTSNQ
jgi:hypothetical protein